jgi:hypothetical protein
MPEVGKNLRLISRPLSAPRWNPFHTRTDKSATGPVPGRCSSKETPRVGAAHGLGRPTPQARLTPRCCRSMSSLVSNCITLSWRHSFAGGASPSTCLSRWAARVARLDRRRPKIMKLRASSP